MKKMMNKQKRNKWIIIGASSALFALYFGLYLYLRISHTFIHRAGNYAYDARREIEIDTNHYVEPGQGADIFQVIGTGKLEAVSETNDLSNMGLGIMLDQAAQQVEKQENRKNRLFTLFRPAAFLEVLFWKVVDPNPLAR